VSIAAQLARLRRTVATRWWTSAADFLHFAPLFVAVLGAGVAAKLHSGRWRGPAARARRWRPGLSVLIPERGTPDRLAETLGALDAALAGIDEPTEVIVMVNGAPIEDYRALRALHPRVVFRHS